MAADDRELLSLLKSEETDAATYFSSELAQTQAEAMDRYHARPYGNEVEGRSKVVTHDLEDTINWIMPSLLRTFENSDELFTCDDDHVEDGAEILTATAQYLRHVFFNQVDGENIVHDFLFDGLLQKLGVIRTAWEDPRPEPPVIREGVTVEQLLRYMDDAQYQVLEVEAIDPGEPEAEGFDPFAQAPEQPMDAGPMPGLMAPPEGQAPPQGLMAPPQQPTPVPQAQLPDNIPFARTYAVKLQKTPISGKPVVEVIPPERFLISSRATSIEEAPYHAATFNEFLATLISMYPDKRHLLDPDGAYVGKSDVDGELASDTRQLARFPDEPDMGSQRYDDRYRETVTLRIEYIRCDYDQDDIVELRRVVRVGDVILENEVVEESEFTVWSPIRVSHRAIGRSLADTLVDIQRIRTALTRHAMDGLSRSLLPRTFYDAQKAANDPTFVDQLLDHDVGSAIGVSGNPNDAVMVQVTPDVSASAFQAIEYWDRRSEEASGVNRHAMGIQPQAITDTAKGIDNLQSAANQRVEQVARHAGKSLSVALSKLLRIIVRHQHTPQIFKVSGRRVAWDARQVSDDMTVSVHVGMTAESREKRIAFLGNLMAIQKEILMTMGQSNPLVTLKHFRHTLGQMVNVGGFRDAKPFFGEIPENYQPPPPGPDPKMAEAQGKQQMAQADMQAKQQLAQFQAQQDAQIAQAKLMAESQLKQAEFQRDVQLQGAKLSADREKNGAELEHKRELAQAQLVADAQTNAQKAEFERQIAELKAANEMRIAQVRIQAETELARERMANEMELARWKTEQEIELNRAKIKAMAASVDDGPDDGGPDNSGGDGGIDTSGDDLPGVRFGGNIG